MKFFINKFLKKINLRVEKISHNPTFSNLLVQLLYKNNINLVLDVGANVGQFAQSIRINGYDKKIEVDTYSMTDLIEIAGYDEVDFVKLDIEGGEERVLYSNDFKKAAKKIKSIYVEVHQGLGSNLNNVLYRLDEVGFDKVILTPYSPNQGVYAEKS